ncbi:CAP domain-containing protein [Paludisphaera mucosa]|uniref:CAP domain-containing protein n=1 Tax=Paludisphaera mucosa TaxID=3030827 RepID=A0ABT6FIC2_9BACT|nr:CAP domain-containing protein [Paludisphaera mucosa]MDG3007338.1 CAP domain-containing protein [Paludisphaera mucosa]
MKALSKALAIACALSFLATTDLEAARPPVRRAARPVPQRPAPRVKAAAVTKARGRLTRSAASVATPAIAAPAPTPTVAPAADLAPAIARRILDLTNQQRASAGLAAVAWSDRLAAAAQGDAVDLAARGIVEHVVDGVTPFDRAAAVGYPAAAIGENLFREFPVAPDLALADAVVAAWMDSPDHRANILDAEFTELGVGATLAPSSGDLRDLFAVQLFGRPLP